MYLRMFFLNLILLASLGTSFAEFKPHVGPKTWQNYELLPDYQKWSWIYDDAKDIVQDLNSGSGKYFLEYKMRGGSSHQTLVRRTSDNNIMGIWSAPNHATYILGEIFAFNLARLLGHSDWATPGMTMTLTGPGREMAKKAYSDPKTPKSRSCNQGTILNYMDKNPFYIVGAYMPFIPGMRPEAIPTLVDREHKRRLNKNHFLVKMISKDGPRPENSQIYFNKEKRKGTITLSETSTSVAISTDTELSKQLSFMMLIDALNSQRDRFGPYGSNMEVMYHKENKTFALTLVDNGGISDSSNTISKKFFTGAYGEGVSRFERSVFDKVLALDKLVHQNIKSSLFEYESAEELKIALGYESDFNEGEKILIKPDSCRSNHSWLMDPLKVRWDKRWKAFKNSLKVVAQYLRQFENDKDAFFK